MSHRITTRTKIKDKKLAIQALKQAGWSYNESGSTLRITDGPMRSSAIDLSTGDIRGDTDQHSRNQLGALRKYYGEAKYRQECIKRGALVESREVIKNGDIRLICSMQA
jgi:hypothetical protein